MRHLLFVVIGMGLWLIYIVVGTNYVGWNASNGYGPRLIEWSMRAKAAGSQLHLLLYLHDVIVLFILAFILSFFAVSTIRYQNIRTVVGGVSIATIASFAHPMFPPLTSNVIFSVAVTLLPMLAILIARHFVRRSQQDAA